jgi:aryl-alcohol dehydrogenase-like predicted oxidoreductase
MRPRLIEATKRYMQIAKDHGMSATELALAWCYTRSFVASTIIGATTVEQLKTDIDAYQIKLSDEVVKAVNEVHLEFTNPGQ